MRQRLGFVIAAIVVVLLLIAINSFTYVAQEETTDSELTPNRSTYHSGPTGTRALYDLMSGSGYHVMRWRQVPDKLLNNSSKVSTFVIVGETKLPVTSDEARSILTWVR